MGAKRNKITLTSLIFQVAESNFTDLVAREKEAEG